MGGADGAGDADGAAEEELDGQPDEPPQGAVQPAAEDEPGDGGQQQVEGGLEVPGVALLAAEERAEQVARRGQQRVEPRVRLGQLGQRLARLLERAVREVAQIAMS